MSRTRRIGNIVSGAGHVALVGWILFGGWFAARPDPLEVQEVAVISGAEFAALVDASRQPVEIAETPTPAAPEITEDAPEVDVAPQEPVAPPPDPVTEDVAPPDPVEAPAPEVSETAPELPEPPAEVSVPDAPVDDTPVERPAQVVRPDPAPEPEPEVTEAPETRQAALPEETGETVEEPREATQAPQAADRIVPEAAAPPAASPDTSPRPPARRPEPPQQTQAAETPAPPADDTAADDTAVDDAAVRAALEAALSAAEPEVPTGPPMSSGEKDALRLAVQNCWNVDPGARWAATTVTVALSMTQDGKVVPGSLRMIASEGGDSNTADAAFGAARRAILLCQRDGYPLPPEKYGQWKDIEMTFNPERMRIR